MVLGPGALGAGGGHQEVRGAVGGADLEGDWLAAEAEDLAVAGVVGVAGFGGWLGRLGLRLRLAMPGTISIGIAGATMTAVAMTL